MLPNPKKRGIKSIFDGFGTLFSSSKRRRRDEQPIAHDQPTMEGSPDDVHTSTLMEKAEGLAVSKATLAAVSETPAPSFSDVGPSAAARANRRTPRVEYTATMSMFPNAQNFRVDQMSINSSLHVHNTLDKQMDGWKMLLGNVASNALHDSRARFDAPKCDEDTRVEVTNELMDWIQDREAPQRLLCMTGAAGAGKSALQQTIAERCSKSDILGSAFFFSAGDPTRNNLIHIVPTIAYQLGLRNSALRNTIANAVEEDPLIFEKNIKIQMCTLMVAPFRRVCASGDLDPNTFPHAILIDGLDECSGEENQAELLSAIKHCLLDNDLPFRVFIASRPEWAIRSALDSEPEGYLYQLAYHIKLNDKYDATKDIRRYLWSRLRDIGSRSRDRRAQSHLWPTAEDIEKLVAAASGQFVYAATVVKYVSERRSSPVDRLRTIMDWTPDDSRQTRPFELLDNLYRNILSAAKEMYEAVDTNRGHDFLLLVKAHQINSFANVGLTCQFPVDSFDEIIGLEEGGHQVLFSDLHSLVFFCQDPTITGVWVDMHSYHRSFSEFLYSEIRAQRLFVSEMRVRKYVTESCLQKLLQRQDFLNTDSFYRILNALLRYSFGRATYIDALRLIDFTRNNGWGRIDERLSSPPKIDESDYLVRYHAQGQWRELERFTLGAIQRLSDELHEPELADIVKSYLDKWEAYKEYGFTIAEVSPPVSVLFRVDGADEQDHHGDEGGEVSVSSHSS